MAHNQVKTQQECTDQKNCQEQICKLKNKLIKYDEILEEKDQLHKQLNDFKQWMENVSNKEKQMSNDLLMNLEYQKHQLRKAEESEAVLQTKNKELLDTIDKKNEQIRTLEETQQCLRIEIEQLQTDKERTQNELCKVKVTFFERSRNVDDARVFVLTISRAGGPWPRRFRLGLRFVSVKINGRSVGIKYEHYNAVARPFPRRFI